MLRDPIEQWAVLSALLLLVLLAFPGAIAAVTLFGPLQPTPTWVWAMPRPSPWWTAEPWPTLDTDPCNTAIYECESARGTEQAQRGQCEEYAPPTIEALRATGTALAEEVERLRRTPYGPDPMATTAPGHRAVLPLAVKEW